jgi:hypothetical protein
MDLIGRTKKFPASEIAAEIVSQTEVRQAFIDQALPNPQDIAENLFGLGDGRTIPAW